MYCLRSYRLQYEKFIKNNLVDKKVSIFDLGPFNNNSVDYPDYAKLANRIKQRRAMSEYWYVVQALVWL